MIRRYPGQNNPPAFDVEEQLRQMEREGNKTSYMNVRRTSYVTVGPNFTETAVGYSLNNGYPLSGSNSQTIATTTPIEFKLKVNAGNAFTINKQSNILTTTWYTDQKFSNGNFFHEYSSGNMTLSKGDLTISQGDVRITADNKNLKITGKNSGIDITQGNINITNGDINITGTNRLRLNGANSGIDIDDGDFIMKGSNKSLKLEGTNSNIEIIDGDLTLTGDNKNLKLTGTNSNIEITDGDLILTGDNKNLKLTGTNSGIKITGTNGFLQAPNFSASSAECNVKNLNAVNRKTTQTSQSIDCSKGNYFEYSSTVDNENFSFSNVPQTSNTVYTCVLKCRGSVSTSNFSSNTVIWSRNSFYYDNGTYVRISTNLSTQSNDDIHIITFTTWDNGNTWFADDLKYNV